MDSREARIRPAFGRERRGAETLRRTAELAIEYLTSIEGRPVAARASRERLLVDLGGPLRTHGTDALRVVEDLVRAADHGIVAEGGPRYFGFVIGGALPAALAADWMAATWDQNAAIFAAGPAASVVEEVVSGWLVNLLGLPAGTSTGFTTGCQMAHFTCLAAARHALLARAGWDVEADGLFGAPEVDVVVGDEAHATLLTALQFVGFGRSRVITVASDEQGRMRLDALAAALPAGERPLLVCLQAGNVNTGAFDPLGPAIELVCAGHPGAWVHVDGAFGLWAAASGRFRGLLAGHEGADSWATDGHKWLNVPYDSGYAFVRDPAAHAAALSPQSAAYIQYSGVERDNFRWVPEYSRRARGFATWAALRSLGKAGVADLVERCCDLAARMAGGLRSARAVAAGAEVLNVVVLDQVLVRFRRGDADSGAGAGVGVGAGVGAGADSGPGVGADSGPGEAADADERTREVIRRVQAEGTCWVGGTTWHGVAAMRISVVNWSTTADDIDRSLDAILRAAEA